MNPQDPSNPNLNPAPAQPPPAVAPVQPSAPPAPAMPPVTPPPVAPAPSTAAPAAPAPVPTPPPPMATPASVDVATAEPAPIRPVEIPPTAEPAQQQLPPTPPGSAPPAAEMQVPPHLNGGVPDPSLAPIPNEAPEKKPRSKKPFIVMAIIIAVLAIAGGVWALLGMPGLPKNDTTSNENSAMVGDAANSSSSTTDPNDPTATGDGSEVSGGQTTATGPTTVVGGVSYATVFKSCYSFQLPAPNNIPTDTLCSINANYGTGLTRRIIIAPNTTNWSSIEAALAEVKSAYKLISPVDRKIKLAGSDAYETTYTTSSGQKAVKIIVSAVGKGYKLAGAAITGFEINLPANTEAEKAAVVQLEKSWAWK